MVLALALAACAGTPASTAPSARSADAVASFDHSHAAFAKVLDGAVSSDGRVRYALLREREKALDAYVDGLADVRVHGMSKPEQLAFWVNAYNAVTLSLIVDNPSIASIRDLDGGEVWKARRFKVGGQLVTLDQMENEKARPLTDGRGHDVVNCASVGCPPLPPRPLVPDHLDAQLDAAAARWVRTNAYDIRGDTLYLSKIFQWYPGDFEGYRQDAIPGANEAHTRALWFLARYADKNVATRLTAGAYNLDWNEYDWSLNQAE